MTRQKIYGLFHGGHSYATWNAFDKRDVEEFRSLAHAREVFLYRYQGMDHSRPCVDESATMWICFDDPFENGDVYPDRILSVGPRGGIKMERA